MLEAVIFAATGPVVIGILAALSGLCENAMEKNSD